MFAPTDISNPAGCFKSVFKQLHTLPAYDGDEMFFFSNRRGWWIVGTSLGLDDGNEDGILFRNRTEPGSDIVPTSGWEVASAPRRFESDPTMTATPFKEVSEHICSSIRISAKGEAAMLCPDSLGTFKPVPGGYSYGRQVFRNASGRCLLVDIGGVWSICKNLHSVDAVSLISGCAPGICSADPRAKYNAHGFNCWRYVNKQGKLVESESITIICSTHTHPPAHTADIDDLVKFIEGEEESTSKSNKETKKRPKRKKSKSQIDPPVVDGEESGVGDETDTGLDALGAVGGEVSEVDNLVTLDLSESVPGILVENVEFAEKIARHAKAQVEMKLRKFQDLEKEKEEINAKIKRNEIRHQVHLAEKKDNIEQQSKSMEDLKLNISKNKEMKDKNDMQIKHLLQENETIAINLKRLIERKMMLESITERRIEEFIIEEEVIKLEKTNLIDDLQMNIEATENLAKFEVNNNKGTRSNEENSSKGVERLRRSIERKEKCIAKKEEDLECSVCLEIARVPIFMCSEQHIISSCCSAEIAKCPLCREELSRPLRKHRYAEKEAEEVASLRDELADLQEELAEMQGEGEGEGERDKD